MFLFSRRTAAVALLAVVAACADRPLPSAPDATGIPEALPSTSANQMPDTPGARHQRLAHRLAVALADAEFRATVFGALDQSREREGKVYLQGFLGPAHSAARRRLALLAGESGAALDRDLDESPAIEIYLPVPAHRRQWRGDQSVLVATAEGDRDPPVAFDLRGRRQLLDPARPPTTPVIALGRAELPFGNSALAESTCFTACDEPPVSGGDPPASGGGAGLTTPSGLYMTYASFNSTFEGWLKGDPEFEVHILGQDGSGSALKSYQCAGAEAGTPYQYDQNSKSWSGNVLLFSQAQFDAYKLSHPGQAVRVFLVEDDDGACIIKTDSTRASNLFKQLLAAYGAITGGKVDSLVSIKTFNKALTLLNLLKSAWSLITTQDDLVGNAMQDVVAQEYFPGANWIVKGENTVTNGAIRLEMK